MQVNSLRILMDLGCDVLSETQLIKESSYLELGTRDNRNIKKMNATRKRGVDINGVTDFTGTTDEYFESHGDEKFDIVFIDACHDAPFVERDFNNSVKIANKWIILHDMIPPDAKYTARNRCSDSYKVLYHILTKTDFESYTMDENFGLTFVRMPAHPITMTYEDKNIIWRDYANYMADKKLYDREEIKAILDDY